MYKNSFKENRKKKRDKSPVLPQKNRLIDRKYHLESILSVEDISKSYIEEENFMVIKMLCSIKVKENDDNYGLCWADYNSVANSSKYFDRQLKKYYSEGKDWFFFKKTHLYEVLKGSNNEKLKKSSDKVLKKVKGGGLYFFVESCFKGIMKEIINMNRKVKYNNLRNKFRKMENALEDMPKDWLKGVDKVDKMVMLLNFGKNIWNQVRKEIDENKRLKRDYTKNSVVVLFRFEDDDINWKVVNGIKEMNVFNKEFGLKKYLTEKSDGFKGSGCSYVLDYFIVLTKKHFPGLFEMISMFVGNKDSSKDLRVSSLVSSILVTSNKDQKFFSRYFHKLMIGLGCPNSLFVFVNKMTGLSYYKKWDSKIKEDGNLEIALSRIVEYNEAFIGGIDNLTITLFDRLPVKQKNMISRNYWKVVWEAGVGKEVYKTNKKLNFRDLKLKITQMLIFIILGYNFLKSNPKKNNALIFVVIIRRSHKNSISAHSKCLKCFLSFDSISRAKKKTNNFESDLR